MFFESLDQIQPFFRSLFSPCVSFFQLFAIPQRLKPESLNEPFAARLKRFSNCYTPEPMLPSGFFLKKKPPSMMPVRVRVLENRSSYRISSSTSTLNRLPLLPLYTKSKT
jgi:hypothetical protein